MFLEQDLTYIFIKIAILFIVKKVKTLSKNFKKVKQI